MRMPLTLRTLTGAHPAVVVYDPPARVRKVLLGSDGQTRDITDIVGDEAMAEIEAQLLARDESELLDLDGVVDEERRETGEPDELDEATRRMEEERMREASE